MNTGDNLVSVIITTHKRKPSILRRAIDSVINQTYKNIEIIVVDDAPDFEEHSEIVNLTNEYGNMIQYHINNNRSGACGSRNIGIELAKGDFIALLDDDDEWNPNKIDIQLSAMKDDIGLVYGLYIAIFEGGRTTHKNIDKKYSGMIYTELLENGNFIGGCSCPLIKKQCFQNVGVFDETLESAQDYDMWLRIAKVYNIVYINDNLLYYYISEKSITSSIKKRILGRERILEKYKNDLAMNSKATKRIVKDLISYQVLEGEIKKAVETKKNYDIISIVDFCIIVIKASIKRVLLFKNIIIR